MKRNSFLLTFSLNKLNGLLLYHILICVPFYEDDATDSQTSRASNRSYNLFVGYIVGDMLRLQNGKVHFTFFL